MTKLHENEDHGPLDDHWIDRLVDGALSDADRRKVLARLDVEPDGWRHCALAFLEAQSWREALVPMVNREPKAPLVPVQTGIWFGMPKRLRSLPAIAAALLAAFALGWSLRGIPPAAPPEHSDRPIGNRVMATASAPAVPRPEPVRISATAAAPLPEPVLRAWERRGYQVERSQRTVSMQLQNGRRVAVPIDEVRLQFVGHRTY
jgi:hypothetical protein